MLRVYSTLRAYSTAVVRCLGTFTGRHHPTTACREGPSARLVPSEPPRICIPRYSMRIVNQCIVEMRVGIFREIAFKDSWVRIVKSQNRRGCVLEMRSRKLCKKVSDRRPAIEANTTCFRIVFAYL